MHPSKVVHKESVESEVTGKMLASKISIKVREISALFRHRRVCALTSIALLYALASRYFGILRQCCNKLSNCGKAVGKRPRI